MDAKLLLSLEPRTWDFISRLEPKVGLIEYSAHKQETYSLGSIIRDHRKDASTTFSEDKDSICSSQPNSSRDSQRPKVAVVGSGPAGLFASLVLAEFGAEVTLIERGQAVEKRGRDIGALVARRILQADSNFCFGEVSYNRYSYLLLFIQECFNTLSY